MHYSDELINLFASQVYCVYDANNKKTYLLFSKSSHKAKGITWPLRLRYIDGKHMAYITYNFKGPSAYFRFRLLLIGRMVLYLKPERSPYMKHRMGVV